MPIDPLTGHNIDYSGQPLVGSVEASRFGSPESRWTPGGGPQATEHPTGSQLGRALVFGGIGATAFVTGPQWLPWLTNEAGEHIRTFGRNVFGKSLSSGPLMLQKLGQITRPKMPLSSGSSLGDFWYQYAKRFENTSFGGQYLSDLFGVFARAGYVSETLSPWADRQGQTFFFDYGTLKPYAHLNTRRYLESMGVDKATLSSAQYFGWRDGDLYVAKSITEGGKPKLQLGRRLDLANPIELHDKGRVAQAMLINRDGRMGRRNRKGILAADSIFETSRTLPVLGGRPLHGQLLERAHAYASMGVARTSHLLEEMGTELEDYLDFLAPGKLKPDGSRDGAGRLIRTLRESGIWPRFNHASAVVQLGKYAGYAGKVFAGLATINQAGFMMQHGQSHERIIGTGLQAGGMAYLGNKAAKFFGMNTRFGMALGAGLGASGFVKGTPFSEGMIPGVAGILGGFNVMRAGLGEVTGANAIRRWIEETAPGLSKPTTALGLGVLGGLAFSYVRSSSTRHAVISGPKRQRYLRGLQWTHLEDLLDQNRLAPTDSGSKIRFEEFNRLSQLDRDKIRAEVSGYVSSMRKAGNLAELNTPFGGTGITDDLRAKLFERKLTRRAYENVKKKVAEEPNLWRKMAMFADEAPFWRSAGYAGMFAAGLAWVGTFQFASLDTVSDVRAKNRGEQLVPVRRGQKWEFGSSPFEGTDILYYRPTWISRLRSGATQMGSSGRGMLHEALLANFTYKLERESYWDKPAPITGAAFEGVPFIYPLLKPFGDLFKKPKLMHVDEWARLGPSGDIEYMERGTGLDPLPSFALGGLGMPAPVSPYSGKRTWGRWWQDVTSASGLVGFYAREVKRVVTGSAGFADQRNELESWHENIDMTSRFYDLHTGGGFMGIPFVSEPIRRFLVKNDVDQYNPIPNNMPDWMPIDMQYGNPYVSLRYGSGEWRLPGEGFAAMFPELKGVDPQDYPLLHRAIILGDTSYWSSQYREAMDDAMARVHSGEYNEDQMRFLLNYQAAVKTKRDQRYFDPYLYKGSQYERIEGTIASVNPENMTFTLQEYGGTYQLAGLSNNTAELITQLNMDVKEAAQAKAANASLFADAMPVGEKVNITLPTNIGDAVSSQGYIDAGVNLSGRSVASQLIRRGDFAVTDSLVGAYSQRGFFQKLIGGTWESFSHTVGKATAPAEYLTMFGFSPMMKFMPFRDPLEEYEAMHLYGEDIRLWQKPLSHWFAPAVRTFKHNILGMDYTPSHIDSQREVEEYFDKLKYYKYKMLQSEALAKQDQEMAAHYGRVARETNIGGHGFTTENRTRSLMGGAESRYAKAFIHEADPSRQSEILEALPEYKQRLLAGQYAHREIRALQSIGAVGGLGLKGQARLQELSQLQADEGFLRSGRMNRAFEQGALEGESYADFRRRQELAAYFGEANLPRPDWIGFNPAVDLEDVKLKYVASEGMDYHDFNIYPSRAAYIARKPYITDQDIGQLNPTDVETTLPLLDRVNNWAGVPLSALRYNMYGPNRDSSFIQYNLTQEHNLLIEALIE
jgi:hypothetical protein